jgi:hypothetical protein
MDLYDRRGIAARLRELIYGVEQHERSALAETARRLRVDEQELRLSLDEESPRPTLEVLAAVVQDYGVDPTWLVTGTYDTGTHRLAEERNSTTGAAAVTAAVVDRLTPANNPRQSRSASDHSPDSMP